MKTQPVAILSKNGPHSPPDPPANLTGPGADLWRSVMVQYAIRDSGGQMLLLQACEALNRAEACARTIARDGLTIATRVGLKDHPLLRHETNNRGLCCRLLSKLGLNLEAVKPMGRPSGEFTGVSFRDLPP
jgi:hypothetical protein